MKGIIYILLSIMILSSCVSKSKYDELASEKEELEYANENLNERILELEGVIYEMNEANKTEEEALWELQIEIMNLKSTINNREQRIDIMQDFIDRAKRACILWEDNTSLALSILNDCPVWN